MFLQYGFFYKQFGIRRPQQLLMPRIYTLDNLIFPRNSLYHYVSYDGNGLNPDPNSTFLKVYKKRIMIDFVTELTSTLGNPRHRLLPILQMVKPFLNKNREFRYIKDPYVKNTDINTLVLIDHAYTHRVYKYPNNPISEYYSWFNTEKTLWNKVKEVADNSDREQFIVYDIPNILPSVSMLKMFSVKTNKTILRIFDTPGKLFILEVWKWLDEKNRHLSMLAELTEDQLSKVNLVFTHNGKWTAINLGYLNQWRDTEDSEEVPGVSRFKPLILQKFFLKSLMVLVSKAAELEEDLEAVNAEDENPAERAVGDDTDIEQTLSDDEGEDDVGTDNNYSTISDISNKASAISNKELVKDVSDSDVDKFISVQLDSSIDSILKEIDGDLEALEYIEKKNLKDKQIHINKDGEAEHSIPEVKKVTANETIAEIMTSKTPEDRINEHLEEYAGYGVISASDYKSLKKSIEKSAVIKNPYDSTKLLKDSVTVTKEDTEIKAEDKELISDSNIEDRSMLHSSLKVFDKQYVRNVMHKDIVSCVHHLQNAGVIVEEYGVEKQNSVLGEYEAHTLKLRPIDGKSSTVRFKIPVINEDSTYLANGNKYILRKQRVDLPIRKIKPTIVGLTSYYGKTFVQRSEFSRNNVIDWLVRSINKIYFDENNTALKVFPGNVYNNYFKAPYIYNGLSEHYKSLTINELELIFDYKWYKSLKLAGKDEISKAGGVIVGISKKGAPIVMMPDNLFYVNGESIGSIYTLLGLDETSTPVDFASVKIFSKSIPISIVLGYLIGFTKLLSLITSDYVVIDGSRVKGIDVKGWSLKFKDRIYIFKKDDLLAQMLLGGFKAYEKLISKYTVDLFDQKEVYMNILEDQKLSSIYVKEIDNMNNLFIDPITKEVLEEMKMPVTFQGLLLESCEMLKDYNSPDFQDMNFMRIRGYERVAGAIYKELAHATRAYRTRNIRGRTQIELNPYAIWKNIDTDTSKKIIEDINPIQNMKEIESATYAGSGGRSKETMTRETRAFHQTDIGVISEATSDSSDAGINFYLTADPNFKSVRGIVNQEAKKDNANILSTSALLAPGSDHDDPKRVNNYNLL